MQAVPNLPGKTLVRGVAIQRVNILIGEDVLELREPGITATHQLVEAVLDDHVVAAIVDVGSLFAEWEAEQQAGAQAAQAVAEESGADQEGILAALRQRFTLGKFLARNLGRVIGALKSALLPLLTQKAGLAAAIVLDTKANQRTLKLTSEELRQHVQAEMSPSQAIHLLVELKDLIDWGELLGKVKTLLPTAKAVASVPMAEGSEDVDLTPPVPAGPTVVTKEQLGLS